MICVLAHDALRREVCAKANKTPRNRASFEPSKFSITHHVERPEIILTKKSLDKSRLLATVHVKLILSHMKNILCTTLIGALGLVVSQAAEINQAAPDFTAKNVKGETVSLADFKGKVVVLEWTNYDCPFVKKHYEGKNIPSLQESYTAKGVIWLTISSSAEGKQGYHEPSKMAEIAASQGNKATHFIVDADGKVGKAYDAKVTPHMFIISADGKLVYDGAIDSKATTNTEDVATADKLFVNALDAVLAGKEVENAKNKPYGCGVKF